VAGPKDTKSSAISSFFGDDDDWMEEEEEEEAAPPAPAALPAAPPAAAPPVAPPPLAPWSESPPPPPVAAPVAAPPVAPPPVVPVAPSTLAAPPVVAPPVTPPPLAPVVLPAAPPASIEPAPSEVTADRTGFAPDVTSTIEGFTPIVVPALGGVAVPPPVAPPPPPPFMAPSAAPPSLDSFLLDAAALRAPDEARTPPAFTRLDPMEVGSLGFGAEGEPGGEAGRAAAEDWEPSWGAAIETLEREAEGRGAAGASLRVDAARAALRTLHDPFRARMLLDGVPLATAGRSAVAGDLADATGQVWEAARSWADAAGVAEGATAAMGFRRAAVASAGGPDALGWAASAADADPADLLAWWTLRDEAVRQSSDADLLRALEGIAERTDGEPSADAHLARAGWLGRAGRSAEALVALQDARRADPDSGSAWRGIEGLLVAEERWGDLAELYADEARRSADGDARWWWLLSARAARAAGADDVASGAYALAVAAGSLAAVPEQLAWLLGAARTEDAAEAARAAASVLSGPDAADAWMLVGALEELRFGRPEVAVDAWRAAAGDPVAGAAVVRCLSAAGDDASLRGALEAAVEASPDGASRERLLLAELRERSASAEQLAGLLETFASLARAPGGGRRELEGLLRAARRADDAALLVEALEGLAARAVSDVARGELLSDAAQLLRYRLHDAPKAVAMLKAGPRYQPRGWELDVALAVEQADHVAAAGLLEGAAEGETPVDAADLLYRSALLHHVSASSSAEVTTGLLDRALALYPEHGDASALLAELVGADRPDLLIAAARSFGEDGRRGVAALQLVIGQEVAGDTPGLVGAVAAFRQDEAAGQEAWLLGLSGAERACALATHRAPVSATAAQEAFEGVEGPTESPIALVRTAEACGAIAVAVRLAIASGHVGALREGLRVAEGAAPELLPGVLDALEATDGRIHATRARARLARGDAAATLAAQNALAEAEPSPALRSAHGRRAGALAMALGRAEDAAVGYGLAREAEPERAEAWEGEIDARLAIGDRDGVVALLDAGVPWPAGRQGGDGARRTAELLSEVRPEASADAWAAAAASGGLYDRLGREIALAREGRWAELFGAWSERLAETFSGEERARLERCRRRLLAERLAETDEAWELYQQLHTADPSDRDVMENLARIAGVRGERDQAIAFLEQLAETAPTTSDAARYHRRIAEIWAREGDDAYAQQALYNALDFQPDDLDALAGLKEIARKGEDWEALRSVLQREASIASAEQRVRVLREIATLVDERFPDRAEALDAWRAVYDANPSDTSVLWRMEQLAEQAGELENLLEIGATLEGRLEGAERAAMLRRMGGVCEQLGRRDDAIHHYEQAVAAEEPDPDAAVRLEELYRQLHDHAGVVRALLAQARLATHEVERIDRMLEAARIEQGMRHDREAAGRLFEEVLRIDEEQPEALRGFGHWLFDAGRHAEALPIFDRIVAGLPAEVLPEERVERSILLYRLGELLRIAEQLDGARARLLEALELNTVHLPTLEAVGPLLVQAEMWDDAERVWSQILAITGGTTDFERAAHTLTMLGRIDHARGSTESAWSRFNQALALHPNHVAALRGLAAILEERRDWNALLTVYNSIIYHATLPADVIEAYMTKGRILDEQLDRQDKAVQHYERSLAFEARQPGACLRLAELALRREAWEDAAAYAARGLDVALDQPEVIADLHLARALALHAMDDVGGAEAALGSARDAWPAHRDLVGAAPLRDPVATRAALRARLPR
jgi:tetratricopeptide (TPR) repeat protein